MLRIIFLRKILIAVGALLLLSACVAQLPWASAEKVQRAVYSNSGPASVTLITVISDRGAAGHSALLVNGSQRVIYDPAGTWFNFDVPERADILYGITPKMLQYYLDYHAREGFRVVMQSKTLSRATADGLIRRAIDGGASFSGFCAANTSKLLSQTPGFEGFPISLYPKSAVAAFAALPGVSTKNIIQHDEGKDLK